MDLSKSSSHTALSHPAKQWCFCSSLQSNEEEDPRSGQDVGVERHAIIPTMERMSPKTLFCAALFLSVLATPTALDAATERVDGSTTVTITDNTGSDKNYLITSSGTLTIDTNGRSHTIYGEFLGGGISYNEQSQSVVGDYIDATGSGTGGTVIITGGGTLTYGGFKDITYYSSTYTFIDGGTEEAGLWTSSLIGVTADGSDGYYDWQSTAFSGSLIVEGGTTLEVGGYLTQYVRYYDSISNGIGGGQAAFVGVQRVYLNDDSKISFASATKNLENTDFDTSDAIAGSSTGEPTTALRYLVDVTASMNSTIELGLDADSTVRLVIHTRADINDASVGILSGTGRLYFSGETDSAHNPQTSIAILNQATFYTLTGDSSDVDPSTDLTTMESILSYITWLNETHDLVGEKHDEENNTYSAYNVADVFVSGVNLKLGSADGSGVVNNVLATATAVQLQVAGGYTQYSGTSTVETIPVYSNLSGGDASYLTIYGVQVLNNLQSLFAERVCYSDEGAGTAGLDGYTELYHYYYDPLNTSYPIRGATSSVILMAEGSTTIVNQSYNRDGYYSGSFRAAETVGGQGDATVTANDSIIVKTGEGTFANISPSRGNHDSTQLINRLYILEGKWIASVDKLGSGRIIIDGGELWILATDEVITCEARIEGNSSLVIAQSSVYYADEEDEDGTITSTPHGGLINDGREYYVTASGIYLYPGTLSDNALGESHVKFEQAQNAYYGDITVKQGMWLILGNKGDWGTSSIFPNANSITLAGTGNGIGQMSGLEISSYQIIVNLDGEAGKSEVSLSSYSTIVLVTTDSTYDFRGDIYGAGGIVKYGDEVLTLGSSVSGYYGETVVMDGSLALAKENTIITSSGLILSSGTSVANSVSSATQTFGALIGESDSTINMDKGDLVVGYGYVDEQLTDIRNALNGDEAATRYYFVTYNGEHYEELLGIGSHGDGSNSAGLSDSLQELFNGRVLGSDRPDTTITVVDTAEYLEDPGHIKEAFAHIYATIDAETFDTISSTSEWNAIFGSTGATTLAELLDTVLDYETIYDYVKDEKEKIQNGGSSNWTERQLDYLLELAGEIKDKGAAGFLEAEGDGTYNLTVNLWQELVDSCFLTYLEDVYGVDAELVDSWSSSLYNFIAYFDEDYSFRLTQANLNILQDRYGFSSGSWDTSSLYESFDEAIGIYTSSDYGPSYDGVISGTGVLEKRGTESLILTGVNTYTGATLVKAGELRIDHDAISRSSYIDIYEGALLTIVADSTDEDTSFVLSSRRDGDGQIIGEGTILIDADSSAARLVIEKALAHDDAFTGSIIVGMGTLVVNIEEREVFSPDIYINADAVFEFDFQDEGSDLVLTGSVKGQGTFIKSGEGRLTFDDGDAFAVADNNSVTLEIDGGSVKFNLDGIVDETGNPQTTFRDSSTTIIVTSGTTLTFDIAEDVAYTMAAQIEGMGSFEKDGAGSLTLNRTNGQDSIWQLDTFSILNGVVAINAGASYAFVHIYAAPTEEITDDDGNVVETIETALVVNGDLTVSDGEIYGSISGSGSITKTSFSEIMLLAGIDDDPDDGEPDDGDTSSILLIAGDISKFTGDFYIESGTLQIDSDTDQEVYAAIYGNRDEVIGPDDPDPIVIEGETTTLVKSGSGSVAFYGNDEDECLDLLKVDVVVEGGKLTLDGAKFATEVVSDTGDTTEVTHFLSSASIAADSTLEIFFKDVQTAEGEDYWDLATIELSGEGTFEIGSGSVKLSTRDNSEDFTGTFYIDDGAELLLGESIDSLSGIGGEGTLAIAESVDEFTFNVESDSTFTGYLEAKNEGGTILTIVGEGRLSLADSEGSTADLENISEIHVGKDGTAGHIGISSDQTFMFGSEQLSVNVDVSGSSVALTDEIYFSTQAKTSVVLADGVTEIGLLANGVIEFSDEEENIVETIFNLQDSTGEIPTVDITLSNFANGTLKIYSISQIADNVSLATSGSGTLEIYVAEDEEDQTYAGSISGTGNLDKTGGGTLILTAASHSYTGTTTVTAGTLAFKTDSGYGSVALDSSKIIVVSGATLSGGVALTAENADVKFKDGSTYLVDVTRGESLSYTGTISGSVDIVVDATSRARGTAYSVIRYTGDGEGSLDDLTIKSITALDAPVFVDNTDNGNVVIYVATSDLSSVAGADLHDGLHSFLKTLSKWACPDENGKLNGTADQQAIGTAIIKTSTHDLSNVVNNLSPLGLGSTITMVHAGLNSDVNTIEARLEQRLYDNMSPNSIWMYSEDWEFFTQVQGSYVSNDDDNDTMTYDYYTYGLLAGMDKKFSLENTLGFALSYDHGKADIHHGGGKIESDALRVILFGGSLLNEFISINYGAEVGYAYYDVKRKTIMGRNKGDTDGIFGGVFLDFVGAFELMQTLDGSRVDLLPHIGVTVSYYNVGSYNESGSISALDVDSFDAISVRGRIGAQVNWMVPTGAGFGDGAVRSSLDLSYVREFCDDDTDIDAKMLGENASATAKIISENSFTLTPSVAYDFDGHTSVFLSYEFLISTDSEVAHTVHLGLRHRF